MLIRELLLHGIFQDKKIPPSAAWRLFKRCIQSCCRWRTTPYVMLIQLIDSPVSSSIVPNGAGPSRELFCRVPMADKCSRWAPAVRHVEQSLVLFAYCGITRASGFLELFPIQNLHVVTVVFDEARLPARHFFDRGRYQVECRQQPLEMSRACHSLLAVTQSSCFSRLQRVINQGSLATSPSLPVAARPGLATAGRSTAARRPAAADALAAAGSRRTLLRAHRL